MSALDPDNGCPECGTVGREHAPECTYESACDHESPHCPHAERVAVPAVPLVWQLADERLRRAPEPQPGEIGYRHPYPPSQIEWEGDH